MAGAYTEFNLHGEWGGGGAQCDKMVKMIEKRGNSVFVTIILYAPGSPFGSEDKTVLQPPPGLLTPFFIGTRF